jgi:hypothetical protein
MTSGLNNNGVASNGVLEGTVDLVERFGTFPTNLLLQAAAYQTTNGGTRVAEAPAGQFLTINPRLLALDLPVAHAGTNQTREAGSPVTLNGSASTAPSGLPLSYHWTQLAGLPVTLTSSNTTVTGFTATTNANAVLTFQLTVHDTRFDSNASVNVTLTEIVDTDGDGLSDWEETTGLDNPLTAPNPAGHLTLPGLADTDGDGQSDGAEALAGTNPTNATSAFQITRVAGAFELEWAAVAGKTYIVEYRDQLTHPWGSLTNIAALTPATNFLDTTAGSVSQRFYRVRLAP